MTSERTEELYRLLLSKGVSGGTLQGDCISAYEYRLYGNQDAGVSVSGKQSPGWKIWWMRCWRF